MQLIETHTEKRPFFTSKILAGIFIGILLASVLLVGFVTETPRQERINHTFADALVVMPLTFIPHTGQLDGGAAFEAIGSHGGLIFIRRVVRSE